MKRSRERLYTHSKWNLNKADWKNFKLELDRTLRDKTPECDDIDDYNNAIIKMFNVSATITIPRTKLGKARKPHKIPYWNDEISRAIYNRNRLRNKFRRSGRLDDLIEYKRLKAVAQKLLRNSATNHWRNYISNLTPNTSTSKVWNMIRKMKGVRTSHTIETLTVGSNNYSTNQEKADILAEQYANVSNDRNFTDKFRKRKRVFESTNTLNFVDQPTSPEAEVLNNDFSISELNFAIRVSRKKKATGEDEIPYEFFQNASESVRQAILRFYNTIWKHRKVPLVWKHAIVLPILKTGKNKNNPASYRPISLTSVISKIMEKMISMRPNGSWNITIY